MSPELPPNERPPRVKRLRRTAPVLPPSAARRPGGRPWLALLPLLCVVLAGGTTRWSQGIVVGLLGLVLLVLPPRASLGRGMHLVLGGLLLLSLMAFVPAGWFATPGWRAALTDDFGTVLPGTLSAQPWLSAERVVLFLAGTSWFYLMATLRWGDGERVRAGRIFAFGVAALAAVFVTLFKLDIVVPGWVNTRHFGPFPNRNQTADFLALGALAVLASAHASWRAGRRVTAGAWLAAWMVVALAVFNNYSRAGVGLLFAGTAAYVIAETIRSARRRQAFREVKDGDPLPARERFVARWRRVALAVSLLLVLCSGFFLFGGDTLERFQFGPAGEAEPVVSGSYRVLVQRDAIDMIAASPPYGVGLGCFAPVFELFRRRSALPVWLIHPESDWLWMTAELGWPALALALAGLVLLARRMRPWRRGVDRPLRTAAALAVGLFALHGLVDVSAHRLGTALCATFLLGLAMPGQGDTDGPDGGTGFRAAPQGMGIIFRLLGLVLLGVGGLWVLESLGRVLAPGEVGVARLTALAFAEGRAGDYPDAERAIGQALAWAPLDWELYFTRATVRLYGRHDTPGALEDFRRARYLQPFAGDSCQVEAESWAAMGETALAVNALAEACRRQPARAAFYMNGVSGMAGENRAAFQAQFQRVLRHDPAGEIAYLNSMNRADTPPMIAAILEDDPDLRAFNDVEKRTVLGLWASMGDAAAMDKATEAHPDWQRAGWRWWASACARISQEERACGIATRFAAPPRVPPAAAGAVRPLGELQTEAQQSPSDPGAALRLYRAQRAVGDGYAAMDTLDRFLAQPGCPTYFFYLAALQAAELQHWGQAWEAWQQYLEKTEPWK